MAIKISFVFLTVFLFALVAARPEGETAGDSDAAKVINEMMANLGSQLEKFKAEGLPNLDKLLGEVQENAAKFSSQLGEKGKELLDQIQAKAKEQGLVKE